MDDKLKVLDKLREEKKELEVFLSGNGRFGVGIDLKLFKHFGCGEHEVFIKNDFTKELILKIIKDRLESVNTEIEEMFT